MSRQPLALVVLLAAISALGSSSAGQASPADRTALHYTLELLDPLQPLVGIHVEVAGDEDGVSEFSLAEGWAGLAETGADLELVEVRDPDGPLDHERLAPHRWRVAHSPGAGLALIFELQPTRHRDASGPPEYYLPILEKGLFHGIGAQTLPAPDHCSGAEERAISLAWQGFEEAGWRTVSSFGAEPEVTTRMALDRFRHGLFLAGDLVLEAREIRGQSLMVAVFGQWNFEVQAFIDRAHAVVGLGREFFDDHSKAFYLISLIPVGMDRGSTSWGGTGLTDSFALFLTPNNGLASDERGGGVTWLLAHELFHEWNGHTITLAPPEQLGYWFSEGFTDFYTRRLLARSGLMTPEQELNSWNHRFAEQAANPERHAPAERIREAFWTVREVGDLPYQRGDLIALYADHAIRAASDGERSLDDWMRAMVARCRGAGEGLSSEELIAALGEWTGESAREAIRGWALEGREPELPESIAGAGLALEPCEVPVFDTGFDHEASRASGTITGVRPQGPAARAGLVDGMRFVGWSVNLGQASQAMDVTVREGAETRTISYLPQGAPVGGHRLVRR